MGSELNIEATDLELAYRSKNYSDLKASAQRELFCSSCGNILSHNFKHVYSHPIFDILQCENCKNHFKTVTFSLDKDDSVRYCHICGRERSSSYSCVKKNCPYEFCKTCIKRNVPQSLVDAESGKWKCFACNTKPLWKLRGACAAIMSSLPKRTKAKKKSRENSSDREGKRSNLKDRSYVRRTQHEANQRLSKKLQSICDEESPNPLLESQPSLSVRKQNKSSNLHNGNGNVRSDQKLPHGGGTTRRLQLVPTSSDDTDIEEIVPLKNKKIVKTKFQRENSADKTKIRERTRKSEAGIRECNNAKSDNLGNLQKRAYGSFLCDGNSELASDNSGDEFDVEEEQPKKSTQSKLHVDKRLSTRKARNTLRNSSDDEEKTQKNDIKRKSTAKTMPSTSKKATSKTTNTQVTRRKSRMVSLQSRKDDADLSDSSSDDSVTAELKALMPTAFAKKPKTKDKNNASSAKRKERSNDEEEEASKKKSNSSNSTKSGTLKSANASTKSSKRLTRSASREPNESVTQNLNKSSIFTGRNVSVILKDIAKVVDTKTRNTFGPLRLRNEKPGSDSSSGKEFQSSKLVGHKSHGCWRPMRDIEEDHTMSSPGSSKELDNNDVIPKEQSFALKKSVRDFFDDLRTAAKKVLNDIDDAEKMYCAKDHSMRASMRPVDANRMILETKNVLNTLKQSIDEGEKKIVNYYEGWCKKSRQKDVWRHPKIADTEAKSLTSERSDKKIAKTSKDSDSELSSASTKIASPKNKESRGKSPEVPIADVENSAVVSDCDSEIFSDNETRVSINKSNSPSSGKRIVDKKSKESSENLKKDGDSTKSKLIYSSDEKEVADDAVEHMDDESTEAPEVAARVGSPTLSQFSENNTPSDSRSKTASPVNQPDVSKKRKSTHSTEKNNVISDVDEDTNDEPAEAPEVAARVGSPTLSEFSENNNPSESISKTASPIDRPEDSKKCKSTHSTEKNKVVSDGDEDMNDEPAEVPEVTARADSPTLSQFSENEAPLRNSSGSRSKTATPVDRNKETDNLNISIDPFASDDNDSNPEDPLKDETNIEPINKKNSIKRKSIQAKSNAMVSDSESESNSSQKDQPKDPLAVTDKSGNSDASREEKSNDIEAAENKDTKSDDALSDANTEEYVNPLDMKATLVGEDPAASDAENPEKSTVDPSIDDKDLSETESVANCDVTSMITELYCSSSGTQSHGLIDEQQCSSPGTPPSDDVFADDKPIEQNEEVAKVDKKTSKKRETSKNQKKDDGTKRRNSANPSSLVTNDSSDREESAKKSNQSKDSDACSDLSEDENMRAKKLMLMSSNSDDSSGEQGSQRQSLNKKKSNDSPLTPPESDSKSEKSYKSLDNDSKERDSEGTEKIGETEKPRKKRSKFRINKHRCYMEDEKLKQKCEIHVERLEENILKRYSRALKKSKIYVESKEIQRLVALDGLSKDRRRVNISSDDEDTSSNLKRNTRKTRAKEREETLMDHLKKVENGESIVLSSESENETSTSGKKEKLNDKVDDPFVEANKMAKKRMLDSSAESGSDEPPASDAKEDEEVKKPKKVVKKEKADKTSEDEETKKEKAEQGRWRKNKILTLNISDSDSEEESKKYNLSQEKRAEKKMNQGSDSEEEASPKQKKRVRRRVLHSDSDVEVSPISNSDSDDSVQSIKKKKKKKGDSSDEEVEKKKTRKRTRRTRSSDSSTDEKRPKTTRRKRIKAAGTDSDSDEEMDNSQGTPGKSGRKNIRKVLRDKQVAEDTKQAAKDEEERLRRIADRQKLYNEMYEVRLAGEEKVDKLVLDFDEETKEPLVSVDEGLVKRLKPHQAQGIKFMWDACFESVERIKNSKGSGCILAHCMGLGKSFQIVTLAHTLLTHRETGINTILIVCPLSTVLNWANEFKIWLADLPTGDDIEVYELTKMKKNYERKYKLEEWRESGGVMIIGYEMFRNLSNSAKKVRKNIQESFTKSLVNPGPDLIVCDEGHLLKKEDTAISKAMSRVKTLRRIVLTGTPLQNNLIEYHCMVQFVKPNLLGTKKEFTNRFENPITNGQFDDSTEYDVKLMKKRAHVLHKMLEGSVQRFDYSVLTPFLPPKQEYVIFVKLTEVQIKMYQHYLENYARSHRGVGGSLFADFQALQRIWTHPFVMQMNAEKVDRANEKKRLDASDSEGSLRDFIDDGSDTPCSSNSDVQSASGSDEESNQPKTKRGTRANPVPDEPVPTPPAGEENNDETGWWTQFIESDDVYEDIRISSKLLLLFRILKESEQIGDKVLVFSQSLYSLTLIEKFLGMIDDETQRGNHPENLDGHSGSWALGLDYFRLDGQSSADNRRLWCNIFNKPSNTRARLFLISTRAGGLGINLTAANRVIIFDASWNPSHDVQSIFRIYRFGQKKPCYVYRLLAGGTMEEKIYNRQVTKLSLSCRVVDEQQIERHYSNNALAELYKLELPSETESTLNLPKDRLLAEIFLKYKHAVVKYLEHDSLLENQADEGLDEEERQQAWLEYEEEKKGKRLMPAMPYMNYQDQALLQQINMMNMAQQQNVAMNNPAMLADLQNLQRLMQKDYPGLPEAQQKMMASKVVYDMYNYVEKQAMAGHSALPMMNLPAVGAQFGMGNQIQQGLQPAIGHPSMDTLRMYQQSLAHAQNGQMNNYQNNQNQNLGIPRQTPIGQIGQMTGMSTSSSTADDDVMEISSSPDRNPVPSASAPGGSRKNKEE